MFLNRGLVFRKKFLKHKFYCFPYRKFNCVLFVKYLGFKIIYTGAPTYTDAICVVSICLDFKKIFKTQLALLRYPLASNKFAVDLL